MYPGTLKEREREVKILPFSNNRISSRLAQKKRIQITLSFNQTRTYYKVREGKMFVINPIGPLTQLDGVTI